MERVYEDLLKDKEIIEYDFEIEREQRITIRPLDKEEFSWENHIEDIYHPLGTARVRTKNGEPRLSFKVPLFSKDTNEIKACVRVELKPISGTQKEGLRELRSLFLEEPGVQVYEKWGTAVFMENGFKIWLNRDSNDVWWIEIDESEEFSTADLPSWIVVTGFKKSHVNLG